MSWKVSDNIISLYNYSALSGKTEIPSEYHLWCCLTAIAACCKDRLYINKRGKELPNLYTFLIGDSASGKGTAMKHMENIISPLEYLNATEYRGSAVALMDHMTAVNTATLADGRELENNKLFLITPELKDNIGSGPKAEEFAGWATNLWEGEKPLSLLESTRGSGSHLLVSPCINWLAGTTKKWLMDSISRSSIEGGFIGRVAAVHPLNYSLDNRVYSYEIPADVPSVMEMIRERLNAISWLEGEFTLTPKADKIIENWYMTREAPNRDDPIAPVWKRIPQMVIKLAMLFSLATDNSLVIHPEHVSAARTLGTEILNNAKNLLIYANINEDTEVMYQMTVQLKQHKKMLKSVLLKRLGVTLHSFQLAAETLIETNSIKMVMDHGNEMIVWHG